MKAHITLTFVEPLLGTVALNKELYGDYIASKAPVDTDTSDELDSIEEMIEKGTTGFHRLAGVPAVYDYVIKGMLKDYCGMLRRVPGTKSNKIAAYKKIIDGLVFVTPRLIPLVLNGAIGILERPLRAQTAQGERVSLARSETCPVGTTLTFTVTCLSPDVSEGVLREWLDYGELRGMGQWRNGGYGRYTYALEVEA